MLLTGLKNIFEHIGSVPNCMWFDNISCAVIAIKKHGERDLTEMFKRFTLHYGFECNFCNPNSGHEEGSVEGKVGYHRRNFFVPIPEFRDIEEYNRELLELADSNMQREHYKKNRTIAELFLEDKKAMLKLPEREFEVYKFEKAKADNYGKVKFDNHIYSTSPEYAKKQVWIKADAFNIVISFEDIQVPNSIDIREIKTAAFIDKKENLILYGAVGTGKTHLATAIGVEACNRAKKVKFYRTAAFVNHLLDARKNDELKKCLKQLEQLDLLICDEWGYIPFEKEGSQLLFQVISECYERKSLIITTNLEFSKWNGIFYDEKLTSALIDRVIHHSHLLMFTGSSYRLKHSTINC